LFLRTNVIFCTSTSLISYFGSNCVMVKSTQIELVLPAFFQLLDCSQNYRIFNDRAIVWRLKYPSQYNSLVFLTHPVLVCFSAVMVAGGAQHAVAMVI